MIDATRRRFRFVVFDWDGTLADSAALIAGSIQAACRDVGLPVPTEATARYVIGLGADDMLRHIAPGASAERWRELTERYRFHFLAGDDAIPLFAGAAELLAELDRAGALLGVATGKSRRGLERAFRQQPIGHHFVATRCADEGFPKPHPDMLLYLMDRMGVTPEETVMIGDTTHDIQLAHNAGVAAVAVAYGAHPPEGLAELKPAAVVPTIAALRDWLRARV